MHRNLICRVEAVTPIDQPTLRNRLWGLLQTMLSDRRQAWIMDENGGYQQLIPQAGAQDAGTQPVLMDLASQEALISPEEMRLLR
jgi:polyphosphate kinase